MRGTVTYLTLHVAYLSSIHGSAKSEVTLNIARLDPIIKQINVPHKIDHKIDSTITIDLTYTTNRKKGIIGNTYIILSLEFFFRTLP